MFIDLSQYFSDRKRLLTVIVSFYTYSLLKFLLRKSYNLGAVSTYLRTLDSIFKIERDCYRYCIIYAIKVFRRKMVYYKFNVYLKFQCSLFKRQ